MQGLHMYKGKAYRNLESTEQEIKLSRKDKFFLIFSPSIIIRTDVYSQSEIKQGKMVTTVHNETYFYKFKNWVKGLFSEKGGIVEKELPVDGLAEPPKGNPNIETAAPLKCMMCDNCIDGDNPKAFYCQRCFKKHFK